MRTEWILVYLKHYTVMYQEKLKRTQNSQLFIQQPAVIQTGYLQIMSPTYNFYMKTIITEWRSVDIREDILKFLFCLYVTVHRDKFLIIKLISQIYFERTLYMSRTVPLSIVRSFSLYTVQGYMTYRFDDSLRASCHQTCMTYTIAVCAVKNSWWWTENCTKYVEFDFKNKFEKLVHLVCIIIRNI
jgi:hypothetical protein